MKEPFYFRYRYDPEFSDYYLERQITQQQFEQDWKRWWNRISR